MYVHQIFENKDLVLKVSPNCDPKTFDINRYEAFLDALCGNREYQKEAIRESLRYFLSGEYSSLRDLAEENYHNNTKLQEKYLSFENYVKNLQMPNKLSCSIDHATATGKSFVMYGISRIMLAEGAVDQVLVLCPSITIETGLKEKFRMLSGDRTLKDLLPSDAKVINPRIVNASSTIEEGDICVENIHATHTRTKSAIEDSLIGKGQKTLVLNDEAHHLMNATNKSLKKWKEFLIDPNYNFKFIVNVSGTCYIGNEYFSDVIHRFSLRDAIEAQFVKSIRYIAEDSSGNEDEKFQKIFDNHVENKTIKYRKVKPITILVTKNIAACKRLTDKLIEFLAKNEKIDKQNAVEKVLIVTSANEHKGNIPLLQTVDDRENPTEWITSVSMLSEGWDVKNVFQIVPHEQRAFNSKLLIAQVLGRGLRIPEVYKGNQPLVTVFNHDKWSSSIKHLVDEVLEIETRIHSYPIAKREDYNFEIYNIDYKYVEKEVEYPQENSYKLLEKGYITYSSQEKTVKKDTTYVRAVTGERDVKSTLIEFTMYSIADVAHDVYERLRIFDQDAGTNYSQQFSKDKITQIIRKSLATIGDKTKSISELNRNRTLAAFGIIRRKGAKSLRFKIESQKLTKSSTKDIRKTSTVVGNLRRNSTVVYDEYSTKLGDEADQKLLKVLEDDDTLPRFALLNVQNKYFFKTPLNIILASHKPERQFVHELISKRSATAIDAWVKSPDTGFYSIDYSWRKGEHAKRGSFNPDFFLKINNDILVIEIKNDDDVSDENKSKLKYALEHFNRLNQLQRKQKYYLKFLSPISYDLFFKSLSEKTYTDFKSDIEAKLEAI